MGKPSTTRPRQAFGKETFIYVDDDATCENYWEPGQPISARGAIELQNQGNNLWFKNVYVRELAAIPNNRRASAIAALRLNHFGPALDLFGAVDDVRHLIPKFGKVPALIGRQLLEFARLAHSR